MESLHRRIRKVQAMSMQFDPSRIQQPRLAAAPKPAQTARQLSARQPSPMAVARRQRWADIADSSSSDAAPGIPAARGCPPFWFILRVYLTGLFQPNIARRSLMELQRVLRRDPRARRLPAGWRDLVLHLTFQRRAIRRQVRQFVCAALAQEWSNAVLRAWQAWLRLQTFYDPPTWNSWAYHLILVHEFGQQPGRIQ